MSRYKLYCLLFLLFIQSANTFAQNPLIRNMYSADPSARVFGDSVYVYPSHDILATPGHGREGWFCMEDYHVFSSTNLTDWKDDGVVVSQYNVPWAKPDAYSMWAPDCIFRNGKYYFYFPTAPEDTSSYGRGFAIGVAVADKPSGPFVPQSIPIEGVHGIDPNVFIDKDGQAYLYYAQGNLYVAKLKENMLELDSEPTIIQNLPDKGLKEGPYLFERKGIYYLTYPHVAGKTEQLEYATAKSPLGPFKVTGVIMDETPECWTNHQSMIAFKGQWYLFYHHNDYSPQFDKARSIRADSLFFNDDGTIRKVIPTLRGIGITKASDTIQIDRYSKLSESNASVAFLDTANKFKGWALWLKDKNAWAQYNTVDFGNKKMKTVYVKAKSDKGGKLQIHADSLDGAVIAEVNIPTSTEWNLVSAHVSSFKSGIHNLFVTLKDESNVAVDWILFK
jgi:hypothetical protein